jgi:hypothetical protein
MKGGAPLLEVGTIWEKRFDQASAEIFWIEPLNYHIGIPLHPCLPGRSSVEKPHNIQMKIYSLALSMRFKAQSQTVLVVGVADNPEEFSLSVLIFARFSKAFVTLLFSLCWVSSIS